MRTRLSSAMIAGVWAAFLFASPSRADVDWREKGTVTPVKNQGSPTFDASWAFAVTGAVEGYHQIETGTLISLSEQELVDCVAAAEGAACADPSCGQAGCGLDFVVAHGLCAEFSYPYTARQGECKTTCSPAATLDGWSRIFPGDEAALTTAINQGPVIARLEIGDHGRPLAAYTDYTSGVFFSPKFDDTVHQWVLIVGYAEEGGSPYYIVKNSIGTSWGDHGYMKLARGAGDQLAVADNAYSPFGTTSHGACDLVDGSCADLSADACFAAGGAYRGDLSFCPAVCPGCDLDLHADVKPGSPKKEKDSLNLTVTGKATDKCTIDPSTAEYWITDARNPGAPIVTTPIVLDDQGDFSFSVTLDEGPGKPDHRYRIFVRVEDFSGNEATTALRVPNP